MKKLIALFTAFSLLFVLCSCEKVTDTVEEAPSEAEERVPTFVLSDGEEKVVDGETFDDVVIISGDNAQIAFLNCTFHADIVNTAERATKVLILDGCKLDEGVQCIIEHEEKEGTKDTPLPKFCSMQSIDVVCDNCSGTAVTIFSDEPIPLTYNGQTYTVSDIEYFAEVDDNGIVTLTPYEGQEVVDLAVSQWWESGTNVHVCVGEYW